jgi:aminopeptidase C
MTKSMSLVLAAVLVAGCSAQNRANQNEAVTSSNNSAAIAANESDQWSGEQGLPAIANQNPIGACQSFALAAFLDYIYYSKTGQVVDFSQKYISYQALTYMIDNFFNPETKAWTQTPDLGDGISSVMLDSALKTGLIPDAYYPYGDLSQKTGPLFLNLDTYFPTFENSKETFTQEEYRARLNQAYLYPPPTNFKFVMNYFDFSKATTASRILTSPKDFISLMGLTKDSFMIYHNSEYKPPFEPQYTSDFVKNTVLPLFAKATTAKGFKEQVVDANTLREKIMESLKRRMVVMVAGSVWISSWANRTVVSTVGGHAMVIVGYQYQGDRLFFKLRNSWGSAIGVDGYDYVEDNILLPNLVEVTVFN